MRQRPTVTDLFSGAGLFSHAFMRAGFRIVAAVEIDSVAANTYARNIGPHVSVADVRRVSPNAKTDVLIAGPPCQGFSTLGSRNSDDPRNALSLEVLRWARQMHPQVVVIENVAAFLQSATWKRVRGGLHRLGYSVATFELDASDFGVPQIRKRSFAVASKSGALPTIVPPGIRQITVRKAWKGLPKIPNGKNFHYAPKPSALALSRMRVIPPGGDRRNILKRAPRLAAPSWWRLNCEITDAWGRMEWDKPCNTLRTCLQNAPKGRYIHPEQHRVISLREAARLHTIPDEWEFCGLPTQIARQIGNSVPCELGYIVSSAIRRILN